MKIRKKNAVCILCGNVIGNDYISHSSSGAGIRGADEKSGWFLSDHAGECIRHKSR